MQVPPVTVDAPSAVRKRPATDELENATKSSRPNHNPAIAAIQELDVWVAANQQVIDLEKSNAEVTQQREELRGYAFFVPFFVLLAISALS